MEQAAYLGNGGEEAARARVGGLVVAPCQRGEGTVPVWPRVWRGQPGSSGAARLSARGVAWGPWTRVRRWRQPTSSGVAMASSVWRAEWRGRRGRGIGEERKEEDGTGIYICHAPLLPVGNKHRE